MAKLSVVDVRNFKQMMIDLKARFKKKCEEAKGSREHMKYYAEKCVQAHNEAVKQKALGRPGINSRLAARRRRNLLKLNTKPQGRKGQALSSLPV